jgi:hypothetical protein
VRPVLLVTPAPPGAVTEGKSLSGQRVAGAAGNLSVGSMPGSLPAAGALLIELPGPRRDLLDLILLLLAEPGLELSVPASAGTPRCPVRGADMDLIGASHVTSDQLKLAGSTDRLAAAGGRQLAVNVFEVRLGGVDGDVHLAGDLGGAQQG